LGLRIPRFYRVGAAMLRILQTPWKRGEFLPSLPPPLNRWTNKRAFPAFKGNFRKWWRQKKRFEIGDSRLESKTGSSVSNLPTPVLPRVPGTPAEEIDQFIAEINALSGIARRVRVDEMSAALGELIAREKIKRAVMWRTAGIAQWKLADALNAAAVDVILAPHASAGIAPDVDKQAMAQADLGITEADFALPETGTLGLFSSANQPRGVSLLPRVHLAIVRAEAFRADLHQVFAEAKSRGYLVFITGPSRTADIELTLTLGVHGPRALYVWVVE
jgi:L-lactate dehydrogenase complex protein LldG